MPLDLSIPAIVILPPKRSKWGRAIEAVLILGIVVLATLSLAPLFWP